jgi:hypothetical protein
MGGRGMGGFAVAMLVVGLAGCSGKSEKSDDDSEGSPGGSATTGGSAGSSAAGGTAGSSGSNGTGGSVRPPKLGLNIMLRNPDPTLADTAGRTCPTTTGIEWDIGRAIETNGMIVDVDSPTPTDFGSTLADGEDDTTVSCSVTVDGAFSIDGGGIDPLLPPPDGLVNFTLAGTANRPGGANVTGLSVYTPRTFSLRTEAGFPPCAMTAVHEVTPGALWADFDCPALTQPTTPNIACHASGTIVAEYCETE